jgi:hypothetical protein
VNGEFTSGRVTYVYAGDTLVLDNEENSIKLADIKPIDLVVLSTINYLREKTFGKIVVLDISYTYRFDSYDRIMAIVYADHNSTHYLNLNKALVVENLTTLRNEPNDFNPYFWSLYVPKSSIPTITPKPTPTPTPLPPAPYGNWREVARFTGSNRASISYYFTCDHVDWRIGWDVIRSHVHFPLSNFIIQIGVGGKDYYHFINGSFSLFDDPSSGIHYVHDNAADFYVNVRTSIFAHSYTIIVEENIDSPTLTPAQTPEPSPEGLTIGSNVIGPIIVIFAIIGSIIFL